MWYSLSEDTSPSSTMRRSRSRIPYPKRRYRKIRGQFPVGTVDCVNFLVLFRTVSHCSAGEGLESE